MKSAVRSILVALACLGIQTSALLRAQVSGVPDQPSQLANAAAPVQPAPLTAEERFRLYLRGTAGPTAFLLSAAAAGMNQARDNPSAWGQGMEGYSHRFGSSLAQRATAATIQLGVEAALGEDSRYIASRSRGAWSRVQDALAHSFLVRTPSGERAPPMGRLMGAVGGGLLSRTWQPAGHDSFVDGLRSGGISFGFHVGENLFREFWPELKKHLSF